MRGAAGAGAGVRLRAAALPPAVIILRGVDAFTGVSNGELGSEGGLDEDGSIGHGDERLGKCGDLGRAGPAKRAACKERAREGERERGRERGRAGGEWGLVLSSWGLLLLLPHTFLAASSSSICLNVFFFCFPFSPDTLSLRCKWQREEARV